MGLKLSEMRVVALDSAPLIYYVERHPAHIDAIRPLFEQCAQRGLQLVTSMITYIEVLTRPSQMGRSDLCARYRMFLTNSAYFSLHPLNVQVADQAIALRGKYHFRTPDAIQLAVAIVCGADCLLSNDAGLKKCAEVPVVLVDELKG